MEEREGKKNEDLEKKELQIFLRVKLIKAC